MILAALVLLAVGVGDLVRRHVPRRSRWALLGLVGVVLLALGALSAAILPAVAAVVVAAAWTWLLPDDAPPRAGVLPVFGLAVVCAAAVAVAGPRADAGLIGAVWHLPAPIGALPFDRVLLVVGAVAFLLESSNLVVRVALTSERVAGVDGADQVGAERMAADPAEGPAADAGVPGEPAAPVEAGLKGGRLIGPLERLIMMSLTLAGAYALVAAFVAAKGIVRFPEISRDGDKGNRAEYFLVGSMVSWVLALGAALLIWWS